MFDKQVQLGMAALEFDITYANGKWFAWYYEILTNDKLEILDDTTENNRR